jgi:hypothetical protein
MLGSSSSLRDPLPLAIRSDSGVPFASPTVSVVRFFETASGAAGKSHIPVTLSPRRRCSVPFCEGEVADYGSDQMGSKSEMAHRTAVRMATLADEADNDEEREHFIRMRDAWTTLANRCEFLDIPDVTDEQNPVDITAPSFTREND